MAQITNVVNAAAMQWGADVLQIEDDQGVVTIAGADTNRRTITVYTDPDSDGVLFLVPNPGQKRGGIRLVPGAGYGFTHAGPIYGYSSGGTVLVSVVAEGGVIC